MPQDLCRFALTLFFDLMGMGFECAAWVSSTNLLFISFLSLFTFINVVYDFLVGECTIVWCRDPVFGLSVRENKLAL